jgi:hypothetical protein
MDNDGQRGLDQEREALIRRRQELSRDLEELASANAPLKVSELQTRRERIADEVHEIQTHLAELNVDERNSASMEGRE